MQWFRHLGSADQTGESLHLPTPGGVWPWGPHGLTIPPGPLAAPPVDIGLGPVGPEQPVDTDMSSRGAGNQALDTNAGSAPGVGSDTSLLAQICNTLVQGLVPLAEALASLKQSEGAGKFDNHGVAYGAGEAHAKPPPKPILPCGAMCGGP